MKEWKDELMVVWKEKRIKEWKMKIWLTKGWKADRMKGDESMKLDESMKG